jgi:hypothetical protein
MSNSLAIAAVTSTLRNILVDGFSDMPGTSVTTRPLDQVRTGSERPSQVNLFLYQTETNTALSNSNPPGRARSGELARPALALDLNYLVTAFGEDDDETDGHELLGRAMSVLHDHPVLSGGEIEAALPASDLGDQVERVKTSPLPLSVDEISKLWNAFQTQYRLSAAYHASVVLIDSQSPVRAALPVLTRGADDSGVAAQPSLTPPFPTLLSVSVPAGRPRAHLGDALTVSGYHLDGDSVVPVFRNQRLAEPMELPPVAGGSGTVVAVTLPNDPTAWPIGVWGLSLRISRAGEQDRTTNELPFALAPQMLAIAPNPAPRAGDDVTLTITVAPEILPAQLAALLLADREVIANNHAAQTDTLVFEVEDVEAGDYFVRLRVDGIDSELIDYTTVPPTFDTAQRVTIT